MTDSPRVAILVDADNVEGHQIAFAVEQAGQHGTITVRRAFGRLASIKGREQVLTDLGFAAEVALPASRRTKDTADLMIAQFAVRLSERGAIDVIALVSSDSDFAAIARGVAESGVIAIGFGRSDTPAALRQSCASFTPFPQAEPEPPRAAAKGDIGARDLEKLRRVIDAGLDKQGEARLQVIGTQINRAFEGQYKRHFGVSTLSKLIEKIEGYVVRGRGVDAKIVALRKAGKS